MKRRTRQLRVCIACGRRDTRDPSCICSHCLYAGDPGCSHEDRREDRSLCGGHQRPGDDHPDRRACLPGPPLEADDMESGS